MSLRVHELAKELQVPTKNVLAKLRELGEFVKSSSSTIEKPAADKVRACFPVAPHRKSLSQRTVDYQQTESPEHKVTQLTSAQRPGHISPPRPIKRNRREFYRGENPSEFTKWLLDSYVVPCRNWVGSLPRSGYFEDEVAKATKLAHEWAPTLLEGFTKDNILTWIISGLPISPMHAVALHRAGLVPRDVGWSYDDDGKPTLAQRLTLGVLTLEQVIEEALYRRDHS